VAQAEAEVTEIACTGRTIDEVSVHTRPGVLEAWIGELSPNELNRLADGNVRSAELLRALLFSVGGRAHLEGADIDGETLVFASSEIGDGTVKTAGTDDVVESLVSSLVGDLRLQINGFGLPLGLTGAVTSQLRTLAEPVDDLVATILEMLGVGIGEADVWVHGARCGGPGLVG
jgi:uncharacterized membrane protein